MRTIDVGADTLGRNWWATLLRGVAAIFFGLITLIAPGISLAALVLLFGAFAFADGVFAIMSAVRGRQRHDRWGLLLLRGIVGIGAALVALFWPVLTALTLVFVVAGWAIVTGVLEISTAIVLRKQIAGEWLMILAGIASVIFGILLFVFPAAGALALVIWIGAYAVIFGAILVALSFRLRSWLHGHPVQAPHPA